MNIQIELSEDALKKLRLLQYKHGQQHGTRPTESALIESLIAKGFVQSTTPLDVYAYEHTMS